MSQFAGGSTLVPPATSPFSRFPQPPYDPTRAGIPGTIIPPTPLDLEGGGFLDLEGGGVLELEGGSIGGWTQYRPGAVAA